MVDSNIAVASANKKRRRQIRNF